MDAIPESMKLQHATVSIDEIIIFSRTLEQHLQHVEDVLRLIRNADMTFKLKKCFFISKTIADLLYVIAR